MGPPLATIRHCLKSLGTPAVGLSRQPNLPGCLLADGPHLRPWPAGAAWLLALLLGLAVPAVAPAQSQKSTEQQLRKARGELQQIARERRKLEGERGEAAKRLRQADEQLGRSTRALAEFFDQTVQQGADAKVAANWIMGDLSKHLNASNQTLADSSVTPARLAGLLALIDKGTISGKIAKTVFEEMWSTGKDAETVVKEKGLVQISDEGAIIAIVEAVIAAHPQSVADYQAGKEKAIGFLVGQIMKQTKGRANPELVNKLLKERI